LLKGAWPVAPTTRTGFGGWVPVKGDFSLAVFPECVWNDCLADFMGGQPGRGAGVPHSVPDLRYPNS